MRNLSMHQGDIFKLKPLKIKGLATQDEWFILVKDSEGNLIFLSLESDYKVPKSRVITSKSTNVNGDNLYSLEDRVPNHIINKYLKFISDGEER